MKRTNQYKDWAPMHGPTDTLVCHFISSAREKVARSGAEFGDDGMAPDKDGTCLYCPNLSFCQEIVRAYALVQQHQPRWCCGRPLSVKPFDPR